MTLSVGDVAPDFELKDQHGQMVKLSSFRGEKDVVITFFPFAFTGTCTGELCALRDDLGELQNDKVQLLAISCDSPYVQKAFAEKERYNFPLLSDFWPHGAVGQAYGIFDEKKGCDLRGSFIVDKAGLIRFAINTGFDARNHEDYKSALASL
ncbi:MAG TPA: peroxiredoxin [Candidatus Nanopelagicaceae bacterium]|nr:peroxiredoxin [Candidatus Nanopelagicaceae bacterium]